MLCCCFYFFFDLYVLRYVFFFWNGYAKHLLSKKKLKRNHRIIKLVCILRLRKKKSSKRILFVYLAAVQLSLQNMSHTCIPTVYCRTPLWGNIFFSLWQTFGCRQIRSMKKRCESKETMQTFADDISSVRILTKKKRNTQYIYYMWFLCQVIHVIKMRRRKTYTAQKRKSGVFWGDW